MREIKFRAKNLDNQQWLYGDLIHDSEGSIRIVSSQEYSTGTTFVAHAPRVDNYTLGQYIGLKDNNGKEIFEGDIVQTRIGTIYKVIFEECSFRIVGEFGNVLSTNQGAMDRFNVEVIGNIYDNPELLEEE